MSSATIPAVFQQPSRRLYDVIYADSPWRYGHSPVNADAIEAHYPTMGLDALKLMTPPAADDCTLYLWTTMPKQPEAHEVVRSWGFRYVTQLVWAKTGRDGKLLGKIGYWSKGAHEILFICQKGNPGCPFKRKLGEKQLPFHPDSVIFAPRGKHSEKPAVFRELIGNTWPDARKLEMFAREAHLGWDSWGNECEGGIEHAMLPWSLAPNAAKLLAAERPWHLFALTGIGSRPFGDASV